MRVRIYSGKSRSWLYQRIKDSIVNGEPAAFSTGELAVFSTAIDDLRR